MHDFKEIMIMLTNIGKIGETPTFIGINYTRNLPISDHQKSYLKKEAVKIYEKYKKSQFQETYTVKIYEAMVGLVQGFQQIIQQNLVIIAIFII